MPIEIGPQPPTALDTTPRPEAGHFHWIRADPTPVGTALFAFALAVYGVRFVNVNSATIAAGSVTVGLNYAVLVAAIGESICGILAIMRGLSYKGYILSIFGIWLWGFYFLITAGVQSHVFTTNALGWYVLLLDIPAVIMAVPAVVERNIPLVIAFAGLITLQFFLGLGYHEVYNAINTATATKSPPHFSSAVTLLNVSAWAGWVASAALFWLFAVEVYEATGVIRRHEPLA